MPDEDLGEKFVHVCAYIVRIWAEYIIKSGTIKFGMKSCALINPPYKVPKT